MAVWDDLTDLCVCVSHLAMSGHRQVDGGKESDVVDVRPCIRRGEAFRELPSQQLRPDSMMRTAVRTRLRAYVHRALDEKSENKQKRRHKKKHRKRCVWHTRRVGIFREYGIGVTTKVTRLLQQMFRRRFYSHLVYCLGLRRLSPRATYYPRIDSMAIDAAPRHRE